MAATELPACCDSAAPPAMLLEPVRLDVGDLDHAVTPRSDLDGFVNNRWRARHPLPPDRSCWDCFTVLAERSLQQRARIAIDAANAASPGDAERVVADFWRSGMDERAIEAAGIAPLHEELARIDALDSPAAVARYVSGRHARGWGVLFEFDVVADAQDPSRSIARCSQGGLGLPDREFYLDASATGRARRTAYREHVARMLAQSGSPLAHSRAMARAVVAFERRLAKASVARRVLARDVSLRHCRVALTQADDGATTWRWSDFFRAQGVAAPAHLSLPMPAFHATVQAMLSEVPIAHWQAYLRFHTIEGAAAHLDHATAAIQHQFHGRWLRGQAALAPRWKRVLQAMDSQVGESMGVLYLARTLPPAALPALDRLVTALRAALRDRIGRLDWMGATTRGHALRKLAAMRVKLGGPAEADDWSGLRTSAHGWYANMLVAREHRQRQRLARLGQPVAPDRWTMLPQTVNARYDPHRNEVVFPAAILQPPFFDPDADDALNFGGIGAVIAHEMTHAFDDQGSRFGADGRFENWWDEADRARFDALAERLVEHIDRAGQLPPGSAERVDGRLTLGENLADFGGLAIACEALQQQLAGRAGADPMIDGYRQIQRFFLNWAAIWRQNLSPDEHRLRLRTDPHAPASMRANAAASQLAAFVDAFGCQAGDGMWRSPEERMDVW